MQRWFVSRCSLFGFASLVDFVFIPLLLSLSFSPCVFHLSPIHKYTYTYTDYTPYNNLNAHIFTHNSSYLSLSFIFTSSFFHSQHTNHTDTSKVLSFYTQFNVYLLIFGKMEFFLFYVASLICCLHTCLFLFASFHTIRNFYMCLFLSSLFFHCLQFIYVFSPSIVIVVFGVCVYIFSSEINFCRFFC